MAANSSNPFLDSVNAWGERGMAFWNSMLREPAASPFLSPSMTGFMPPGMNFPGMPSDTALESVWQPEFAAYQCGHGLDGPGATVLSDAATGNG